MTGCWSIIISREQRIWSKQWSTYRACWRKRRFRRSRRRAEDGA